MYHVGQVNSVEFDDWRDIWAFKAFSVAIVLSVGGISVE
jgi:hypothetical protein